MHVIRRWAPALFLAAAPFVAASPANAGKLTLGSNLNAAATVVDAQGADTAFWLNSVDGGMVTVPEAGQVISIRVKGSALKEKGAADPATMVHFQTLNAPDGRGARQIHLTSAPFDMPIDNPNAISTFEPENLCVNPGGAVAFNTIGGFKWGGSLDAPLDDRYYHKGTPWQIFAASSLASTAWYSKDNGTKNGMTVTPDGGRGAAEGYGRIEEGRELLMQVVVATGDDRSESCGGPRRHADGSLVQTGPDASYMKVVTAGGKPQQPYVTKNRKFSAGVYCGGEANPTCAGTATMLIGKRVIATAPFSFPAMSTGKIAMRLGKKDFAKLNRLKKLRVTFVLAAPFGTYTSAITLKR